MLSRLDAPLCLTMQFNHLSMSTKPQAFEPLTSNTHRMAVVMQHTCNIGDMVAHDVFMLLNCWNFPPPLPSCLLFLRLSTQLPGIMRASSSFAVTQMELWPYGTSEARASPYRQSHHTVRRCRHTHTHTSCVRNHFLIYSLFCLQYIFCGLREIFMQKLFEGTRNFLRVNTGYTLINNNLIFTRIL